MAAMRFPLLVALLFAPARALDNGLGLTPPLGYNAYDHVGCCDCSAQTKLSVGTHSPTLFTHRRRSVGRRVGSAGANETTMKEQGQALIDTGMHKLGFVYVNSDCGWMGGRHPNGTLFENPTKFRASLPDCLPLRLPATALSMLSALPRAPLAAERMLGAHAASGMKALADWLHLKGLKLGLYSDRGTHDFSGAGLGMKGHEVDDANYLASVGADYLKVDDMSGTPKTIAGATADYGKIRDALNATGRPIFFSTCGHSPGGNACGNTKMSFSRCCFALKSECLNLFAKTGSGQT
eukprot:COSAG06_NODE_6536_length_2891_cov_1.996777_2_plen_294_part_00